MDAIEPILPNPSILPEIRATERAGIVHRDRRGDGSQGEQRRRQQDDDGVEVDVEGLEDTPDEDIVDGPALPAGPVGEAPGLAAGHRIDFRADADGEPPARRIDLTA